MINLEETIKKYVEFYHDKSNTYIADRILESDEPVLLSHRTLRKKVSEFRATVEYENSLKKYTVLPDYYRSHREGTVPIEVTEYTSKPILEEPKPQVRDIIVISDLHGVFLDEECFNVFLEVLKDNPIDEVLINGDLTDLPLLSKHTKKLVNVGPMLNYSEIGEIEFTKNKILKPLREVTNANIVVRLGNHDERITSPLDLTQAQLKRLYILHHHYESTRFEDMLELASIGVDYDPTPVRNYHGLFDVIHGLSLSKNAPEKNILSRFTSGTSGHSHRLNSTYFTKGAANKHYTWLESGHMRLKDNVEYLPTAVTADWQQGFVRVKFNDDLTSFFASTHAIVNGECELNGKLYKG